jgi:hypothetical protein
MQEAKAMVAREFLEELRSIHRNFQWKYVGRNRNIRARAKGRHSPLLDPIGALCYSKTGVIYDEENWFQAAQEIGLSHIDAGDLTAAANNVCNCTDRPYVRNLRRRMVERVRLQPEFDAPAAAESLGRAAFGISR